MIHLLILAAALAATPAATVPAREGDTVELYTVRPGDTLEALTKKYLGDPRLWPENLRLNPHVKDPHRLRPGHELRIITRRSLAERTAQVVLVARQVDEKPTETDWRPSRQGSLLREREGLRTGPSSYSALQFDDGTKIALGEDSILFVREASSTLAGGKTQSLEVEAGQADLKSSAPRGSTRSDIKIMVGDAVLRPTADPGGLGDYRARRDARGDAGIMVFSGRSQVEAGGARVVVPAGMGTSVPKGGSPRRPERLLGSPKNEWPAPDQALGFGNPFFSWRRVAGARAYTLEVCADPACDQLFERATELPAPRHAFPALPRGTYYWRAAGRTASGLDGYPSATTMVTITNGAPDLSPPVLEAQVQGFSVTDQDGIVRVEAGTRVALRARDDGSGVVEVRYRWDGGRWEKDVVGSVAVPLFPGAQLLEFQAVDALGQASGIDSLRVQLGAVLCCTPRRVCCSPGQTIR